MEKGLSFCKCRNLFLTIDVSTVANSLAGNVWQLAEGGDY
jgi:hypothetical protein